MAAGISVVCTGDILRVNGEKYVQIAEGGYIAFSSMTLASTDVRQEAYAALETSKATEKKGIIDTAQNAWKSLKEGMPLSGISHNASLSGVSRFAQSDNVALMDDAGNVLRALNKDDGVVLSGKMVSKNGYEYLELQSGEYVRRDEIYNSPVAQAKEDIKKAQALSLENIIDTPLADLPRMSALRLFTKVFGDGPGTQFWALKDPTGKGFLREMALAKHEGMLSFGRVDDEYRTTFQIALGSYDNCLQMGVVILEGSGISV